MSAKVTVDEDNPTWTEADFERARPASEVLPSDVLAAFRPRGRPKAAVKKVAVKLRLDPDVLEGYRARGERWQTLMNSVLREGLSQQRGVEKKKRA